MKRFLLVTHGSGEHPIEGKTDMMRTKSVRNVLITAFALLATTRTATAQMCGGHSMRGNTSEASEAPTATDVADVIEAYVRHDTKLKGDHFLAYDLERKTPLALEFDRVHEDDLRQVGDRKYFTCTDFKTSDGKVYDLDIFVKGPDREHLEVTEITVHKENGTLRYDWQERDGVWKKRRIEPSDHRVDPEPARERTSLRYEISVDGTGFHPSAVSMKVGSPATLVVTRTTDQTCVKEIVIPSLGINHLLPLDTPVEIVITPERKGDVRFACGMDMLAGVIHVE